MGKKSKKKAIATLERATKRDEPGLPPGCTRVRIDSTDMQSDVDSMTRELIRIKWKPMLDALEAEHGKGTTANDENASNKHNHNTIEMATDLLDDIQSTMAHIQSDLEDMMKGDVRIAIEPEVDAYHLRSLAYLNLNMYEECIEDCTQGLQCGLSKQASFYEVAFLMKRGISLKHLGRLNEAIIDYRAAVAAFRLTTQTWPGWPTLEDATKGLFFATCDQKIGLPRPHFSIEERDSLLKELDLGIYQEDQLKCLQCGQSSINALCMCTGCRRAWFCDQECQRKAWKSGHKKMCKAPLFHVLVGDADEMRREIAEDGFITVFHGHEPAAIMQDPASGELFNSLRDNESAAFGQFGVGANGELTVGTNVNTNGKNIVVFHNPQCSPELQKKIDAYVRAN